MNRKAAIELTTNFLVVIILSIVVLTMGIYLTVKVIGQARDVAGTLDAQTKDQIKRMLDDGGDVVVPFNSYEVPRGKGIMFGIGVQNIEDDAHYFRVLIDKPDVGGCDSSILKPVLRMDGGQPVTRSFQIESKDRRTIDVVVSVPSSTPPCEYVLNAIVQKCSTEACSDAADYGTAQKLYVIVPN